MANPKKRNLNQVLDAVPNFPFEATVRDVRFDKTFKILLGENEARTMSFLNAVLGLSGENRIMNISFMNGSTPELHNRSISFDLKIEAKCHSYSGHIFIVEMQKARHKGHTNRWIYYGARELFKMGGNKYEETITGEFYVSLCPVKVITIVDFDVPDDDLRNTEDYLVHWDITERSSKIIASDLLSWTYIILPQFTKQLAKEPTSDFTGKLLEAWLNLFTMKDQATVMVTPEMTAHDAPLAAAFLRVSRLEKHEIDAVDEDIKLESEYWAVIAEKTKEAVREKDKVIAEKDKEMEEKDKVMEEKDKEMAVMKKELAALKSGKK
jgi:predicted transposase/invertase (TIGR01784 family)